MCKVPERYKKMYCSKFRAQALRTVLDTVSRCQGRLFTLAEYS